MICWDFVSMNTSQTKILVKYSISIQEHIKFLGRVSKIN
jgi:hypothetical protein